LYPAMTEADVEYVGNTVRDLVRQHRRGATSAFTPARVVTPSPAQAI